jgi:protein gp37
LHVELCKQSGIADPIAEWQRRDEGKLPEAHRPRVFCASLADVFEDWQGPILNNEGNEVCICHGCGKITDWRGDCGGSELHCDRVPRRATMDDVRKRLFALIDATPHLDWLLLTKRPENVLRMWPEERTSDHPLMWKLKRKNVWLGTSVENQEYADKRIPELLKCRDLAPVLFLSCEPLLGPVNLERIPITGYNLPHLDVLRRGCWTGPPWGFVNSHNAPSIDWIIAGGESGPNARPSHPDWFRGLRDQCDAAGVPFHFKQWGEWGIGGKDSVAIGNDGNLCPSQGNLLCTRNDTGHLHTLMSRVGKARAGRLLDSVVHDAFPATTTESNHART